MKLMKTLVYTLVLSMSLVGVAEAKGRTASFNGGFSSQRQSAPKPAPQRVTPAVDTQNKNATFGSFGSNKTATNANAASNYQPSKMSKDLTGNTAQANAQKTADARNNPQAQTNSGSSGWFRSGDKNTAQPVGAQPAAIQQPIVVQHSSGGFMNGLMWFMVGHSLAQHSNNSGNMQVSNQNGGVVTDANGAVVPQAQYMPAPEKESFFMKFIRLLLWVVLIAGVVWGVRKLLRFRNRKVNAANYSLGS